MRSGAVIMCAIAATVSPETSFAADRFDINISAMRIDRAIQTLSRQTGVAIGGTEISASGIYTKAVKGRLTLDQALSRMLRGTGYEHVVRDARTVLIKRRSTTVRHPVVPKAVPDAPAAPIIVTASKQNMMIERFPGMAHIFDMSQQPAAASTHSLEGLLQQLPTVSGTNLGPARNKIFLRGVADSSFNGGSQSTLAYYLGETRLVYNSPNPDLQLYDIEKVEILEGPQGTLYGAGSLGGIIRIVPAAPQMDGVKASLWPKASLTAHGAPGYALAGMLNLPINDMAAIRGVAYHKREGGYIDDGGRGLSNINSTEISGLRLGVRLEPAPDWALDVQAVTQKTDTADSQYAELGHPLLMRSSLIAQPYDSDFESYAFSLSKNWGKLQLTSATGLVYHDSRARYDASSLSGNTIPTAFDQRRDIRLLSHETRLALSNENGISGVAGISMVDNRDRMIQSLGAVDALAPLSNVVQTTREYALFGEATAPVLNGVRATLGGRFVHIRSAAEMEVAESVEVEPKRRSSQFLPTAALSWAPDDNGLLYIRFQRGYRSGGISVSGNAGENIIHFKPDAMDTWEAGVRWGLSPSAPIRGSVTGFLSKWRRIQADLVDERGFPMTLNIGDGKIYGVAADIEWHPSPLMQVTLGMFANESELVKPAEGFDPGEDGRLPNIAELGAQFQVQKRWPLAGDRYLITMAGLRYIGKSQLGIGPNLSIEQGGYTVANALVELGGERWTYFIEIDNLTNSGTNSFSLGNPFTISRRDQITPLRPRTFSIGLKAGF
ncbi:MAG: TonB-dependent receptor [Sphingobium sp.]|nr:TonB-dependent receptor [Sphingobium sp.]MCP5398966.1 TonB-dependent receptor [Sphingomonas sp.]